MAAVARASSRMQFGTLTLEQWHATLSRRASSPSSPTSPSSPKPDPSKLRATAAAAAAAAPCAPTWADRVKAKRSGVVRPNDVPPPTVAHATRQRAPPVAAQAANAAAPPAAPPRERADSSDSGGEQLAAQANGFDAQTADHQHHDGDELRIPRRRVRGLVNCGNSCFINVVLQALMACEPFRRLLLRQARCAHVPTLMRKFVRLAEEMSVAEHELGADGERDDEALLPDWMLDIFQPASAHAGSQEDAEEFLTFVLNALHEEQVALTKGRGADGRARAEEEGWEEITRGGRSVHIRGGGWESSVMTEVFGGTLRGEVRRAGQKASVTKEPFWSLSVDIDSAMVRNVDEALSAYFAPEEVGERGVRRQVTLATAPAVLVLHLKRFSHNGATGALEKVARVLPFGETLRLGARRYELRAVVTHVGRELAGGHYTCDVRDGDGGGGGAQWLWCDDARVARVARAAVLRRAAYLLFYTAEGAN